MGDSVAQRTGRQPQAAVTSGYQVDWAGLAHNLSHPLREAFLSAVDTLLSFSPLPINEFKMNFRKITALIELAHRTLLNSGVLVYEFSYCRPSLLRYKVAYISLLRFLRDRRYDVDSSLQDRVRRLLVPLSPNFHFRRRGTATTTPTTYLPLPQGIVQNPTASTSNGCSRPNTTSRVPSPLTTTMPPPSLPLSSSKRRVISSRDIHRSKRRLWSPDEACLLLLASCPPKGKGARKGETNGRRRRSATIQSNFHNVASLITVKPDTALDDQENAAPASAESSGAASSSGLNGSGSGGGAPVPYRIIRQMVPRRFGIFCTGKTSMHGPNPRAWRGPRPVAVRPVE